MNNNVYMSHTYIKHNQDYIPERDGIQMIMGLHVTRPLTAGIFITNMSGDVIYIPNTALVSGGIYNYPVTKIEYENPENDDQAILGIHYSYNKNKNKK